MKEKKNNNITKFSSTWLGGRDSCILTEVDFNEWQQLDDGWNKISSYDFN